MIFSEIVLRCLSGPCKNAVTGLPGVSKSRISREDGAQKCQNIGSKRFQIRRLKMDFLAPSSRETDFLTPPEKLQKGSLRDAAGLGRDLHVNLRIKSDFGPPETRFYT